MGWFSKKDNGINWQQEVFDISKLMPDLVSKLNGIDKKYDEQAQAGRRQRIEDKEEKKDNKDWQKGIDSILAEAIECPKGKQIDDNTEDIKEFKKDKQLRKGKILGMKFIYVIIVGVLSFTALVLGIMWRLGLL